MDTQALLDMLTGLVIVLISAIIKVLWDAVKTLQKDMTRLEVALPTLYVPKQEFRDEMREIKKMLERIAERLDDKADRTPK
jgi:hypothetical protein